MNVLDSFLRILEIEIHHSPVWIMYVIGLIVCVCKIRSHPKPAIIGAIVFLTAIFMFLLRIATYTMSWSTPIDQRFLRQMQYVNSGMFSVQLLLLIVGLFIGRTPRRRDDDD